MKRYELLEELNKIVMVTSSKHLYDVVKSKTKILDILYSIDSENCTNCKWCDKEVCVNGESRLCTEFVDDEDICLKWEEIVAEKTS